MAVYSVHSTGESAGNMANAGFVKEGFSFAAFFFGPLWLLAHRLWLWLVLWLAGALTLLALLVASLISIGAYLTLHVFMHLLLGLEANRLVEGRLWRQGFNLIDVVAAPHLDEAEFAFYRQFGGAAPEVASVPPAPPPASFSAPSVLGSFPEPGARR